MPVYHIVLFRLKQGITDSQLTTWKSTIAAMQGIIPGLLGVHCNPPHETTAARAKGFNMGLVAVLGNMEDVKNYAGHPAHLEVMKARDELCEDTLAYDLEF